MKIDRIKAIENRIKLQRKNPRFIRGPIQLHYNTLISELSKLPLISKMLTHWYSMNRDFPLFMLVGGLKDEQKKNIK